MYGRDFLLPWNSVQSIVSKMEEAFKPLTEEQLEPSAITSSNGKWENSWKLLKKTRPFTLSIFT